MRAPFVLGVLLTELLLGVGIALADEVPPPPADCPYGTQPDASHAGPHCALATPCTSDSCPGGMACMSSDYCVLDVPCGGLHGRGEPPCTEAHVTGVCGAAGACSGGAHCVHHPVCLYTSVPSAAAPSEPASSEPAPSEPAPSGPPPTASSPTPEPAAPSPAAEESGGCAVSRSASGLASVNAAGLLVTLGILLRRRRAGVLGR